MTGDERAARGRLEALDESRARRVGQSRTPRGPVVVWVPGPVAARRWATATLQAIDGDDGGSAPTLGNADDGTDPVTLRVLCLDAVPAAGERRVAELADGVWVCGSGGAAAIDPTACQPCGACPTADLRLRVSLEMAWVARFGSPIPGVEPEAPGSYSGSVTVDPVPLSVAGWHGYGWVACFPEPCLPHVWGGLAFGAGDNRIGGTGYPLVVIGCQDGGGGPSRLVTWLGVTGARVYPPLWPGFDTLDLTCSDVFGRHAWWQLIAFGGEVVNVGGVLFPRIQLGGSAPYVGDCDPLAQVVEYHQHPGRNPVTGYPGHSLDATIDWGPV